MASTRAHAQLSDFDFQAANAYAANAAGVAPLPPEQVQQGELEGGASGETGGTSEAPTITIDTNQIQQDLGITDELTLQAAVTVTLYHKYWHAAGYGYDESAGDEWWNAPASQSNCEHLGIELAHGRFACDLIELLVVDPLDPLGHLEAMKMMCWFYNVGNGDALNGDMAELYADCLAMQNATPPEYVPPAPELAMPPPEALEAPCPGCED
ncbi:MAG: hypothetical protein GC161_18240 [Planctomycetaceae bacterium]|nr:hypothetical protein [Planctomycetaceae bacterium]